MLLITCVDVYIHTSHLVYYVLEDMDDIIQRMVYRYDCMYYVMYYAPEIQSSPRFLLTFLNTARSFDDLSFSGLRLEY